MSAPEIYPTCGTRSGACAHSYYKTPKCDACKRAQEIYLRRRAEARALKSCSVEGCESSSRLARGMCRKHYEEARKRGDFKPVVTPVDRLHARLVAMPSGCIEFHGRTSHGYGVLMINGKNIRAHRFAWELENGPIPEGLIVLHRCDNPPCCNVRHLVVGTDADNIRDMATKGRSWQQKKTHCPQGHAYTEANTYSSSTRRRCRTCHLASCARRYQRNISTYTEATA